MSSYSRLGACSNEVYAELPIQLEAYDPAPVVSSAPLQSAPAPAPFDDSEAAFWDAQTLIQNPSCDQFLAVTPFDGVSASTSSAAVPPELSPASSPSRSSFSSAASTASCLSNMNSPPTIDNLYYAQPHYQMPLSSDSSPNCALVTDASALTSAWESPRGLPALASESEQYQLAMQLHEQALTSASGPVAMPLMTSHPATAYPVAYDAAAASPCDYTRAPAYSPLPGPYSCPTPRTIPYYHPTAVPPVAMPVQPRSATHKAAPPKSGKRRRNTTESPELRQRKRCATGPMNRDTTREKGFCPYNGCGRAFKDLKAHMLTHQSERPEKCPIEICEYHHKGFARKYDKNRHTLTHFREKMVCGFCPLAGKPGETSFDRVDAFKKHLVLVHKVEQTAPNSRKKSPASLDSKDGVRISQPASRDGQGKCTTCSEVFGNAQDFYEHLDECVLRAVFPLNQSETINARNLSDIAEGEAVKEPMTKQYHYEEATVHAAPVMQSEHTDYDTEGSNPGGDIYNTANPRSSISSSTNSTAPISIASSHTGRAEYPRAWGMPPSELRAKRRVLNVFDGPRRLGRDDMMFDNSLEVRINLPHTDPRGREVYVTDLDVATVNRSEALLDATEEEKGPWMPDPINDHRLIGRSYVSMPPVSQ